MRFGDLLAMFMKKAWPELSSLRTSNFQMLSVTIRLAGRLSTCNSEETGSLVQHSAA